MNRYIPPHPPPPHTHTLFVTYTDGCARTLRDSERKREGRGETERQRQTGYMIGSETLRKGINVHVRDKSTNIRGPHFLRNTLERKCHGVLWGEKGSGETEGRKEGGGEERRNE